MENIFNDNIELRSEKSSPQTLLPSEYWISPDAITIELNALDNPQYLQVSLLAESVILAYRVDVIGYDASYNFRRWVLQAYNNFFDRTDRTYVYAQLEKEGSNALIIYSYEPLLLTGTVTDNAGNTKEVYNVYLATISPSSSGSGELVPRYWEDPFDTGRLSTDQYKEEETKGEWAKMFHLNKVTDLIEPLKDFAFATIYKLYIGSRKTSIIDVQTSSEDDVYLEDRDDVLPTTKQVKDSTERKFLFKIKPDETKYLIKFFDGLEAGLYADGGLDGSKLHNNGLAELGSLQVNGDSEFRGNLSSKEFISGFLTGKGWAIQMKKIINAAGVEEYKAVGELDDLIVRGTLRVFEFVVSQLLGENDNRIFTAMLEVDHYDAKTGKVYLDTQEGKFYNPFRKDDYIMVQQYNGMPSAENDYYVTKQYEMIVTEVGMEDDLAWVTFRNFTTSMEGGTPEVLIARKDTFVRVDNLSDPDRKGIIQMMTVGSNTPYMDVAYGLKTDPDNALKARIGKLEGIYNSLFGWLQSYGAYLVNLYAVGEYRQRNTGEDFDTKIQMLKEQFLTEYKKQYYDITNEDNFLRNTAFLYNLEYWEIESGTRFLTINDDPFYVNRSLLCIKDGFAGIEEHEGKNMLRISDKSITQLNTYIKKPGTHLEMNPSDTEEIEVTDTLYLTLKAQFKTSGTLTIGFRESYHGEGYLPFVEEEVAAIDPNEYKVYQWSGKWDGAGDFEIGYSGDMYVSLLSLTTDPLSNYKITTSTQFKQTDKTIGLYGQRIDKLEGTTTDLGIEIDAANERINLYANKVNTLENTVTRLGLDIDAVDERVTLYAQKTTENEQSISRLEVRVDGISSEVISEIDGNTVVSKINQTATTISIDASKINLNGVVTANETFKIDTDGTFSATAGKIGGFTIDAGRLYWKGKDYFGNDARSIKIGASNSTLEGLVDISFNASTIGRFGVKVLGTNLGGACIFASTKDNGYATPASPYTYAAWLDGDVRCTGKLSANICAATEFFAATSITGGTIEGYKGVTFGFNDYDLDNVRFQVQNGLIVGVKKE